MPAVTRKDLRHLSGEQLLLVRIFGGEPERERVDGELDRRAAFMAAIPIHAFRPVASRAVRRPAYMAA